MEALNMRMGSSKVASPAGYFFVNIFAVIFGFFVNFIVRYALVHHNAEFLNIQDSDFFWSAIISADISSGYYYYSFVFAVFVSLIVCFISTSARGERLGRKLLLLWLYAFMSSLFLLYVYRVAGGVKIEGGPFYYLPYLLFVFLISFRDSWFRGVKKYFLFLVGFVGLSVSVYMIYPSPLDRTSQQTTLSEKDLISSIDSDFIDVDGGSFFLGMPNAYVNVSKMPGLFHVDSVLEPGERGAKMRDDFGGYLIEMQPFSVQKYEVTFEQFAVFSLAKDLKPLSSYTDYSLYNFDLKKYAPKYPANYVSWSEARDYCNWLGEITGKNIELPTAAQWEYAAKSRGLWVDYATNTGELSRGLNVAKSYERENVGSWPANPLGVYDMEGSVKEWILHKWTHSYRDRVRADLYDDEQMKERAVFSKGESRIDTTLSERFTRRSSFIGFRCVINSWEREGE